MIKPISLDQLQAEIADRIETDGPGNWFFLREHVPLTCDRRDIYRPEAINIMFFSLGADGALSDADIDDLRGQLREQCVAFVDDVPKG